MEVLEKIKTKIAEFDAQRVSLMDDLKKDFAPMLLPLFQKYPDVKSISWQQYTPFFNDGDSCEFSVRNDDIYINGYDEYDMSKADREKFSPAKAEFESLLTSIPEDFYKDLFGDHKEVKILCNGEIEVEEYDHD